MLHINGHIRFDPVRQHGAPSSYVADFITVRQEGQKILLKIFLRKKDQIFTYRRKRDLKILLKLKRQTRKNRITFFLYF